MENIEKLENRLWEAADQLRANSALTSSEYFMPVLGLIFLRHAHVRYLAAEAEIKKTLPKRGGVSRAIEKADFDSKSAIFLREHSRFDYLLSLPGGDGVGRAIIDAMDLIENDYDSLKGVLPKEFDIFDDSLLTRMLKIFNDEALNNSAGDVFGRIYEYFLMKFAMQGAQDSGEFFTPISLVQTIVNVIEPNHGVVFDPACGSGGMFVQTSHFLEEAGLDALKTVTFYGQEKTTTTIRLAKMNLTVHGLEGNIREGNTFYEDLHALEGKCDFVMANPPFNVDGVDSEKIKGDSRLPFGLPGVNKKKEVGNGNYLWISYFYSYLNEKGRAGFVMSSQASSAGRGEMEVRRKIVETGHADVMISIRPNFFYTRTVPCELWFFDKAKPKVRRDKVLMIDARSIYRKVTRKIYDFTPEHLKNITAMVRLYRGQTQKYQDIVREYLANIRAQCGQAPKGLKDFNHSFKELKTRVDKFKKACGKNKDLDKNALKRFRESVKELNAGLAQYKKEETSLLKAMGDWKGKSCKTPPKKNNTQIKARKAFAPAAKKIKAFFERIDQLYKLTIQCVDQAEKELGAKKTKEWNGRDIGKQKKAFNTARTRALEQLQLPVYFYKQILWLQTRFPDAKYTDVEGLVKLTDCKEIKKNDWSLTPGRYVGVAPPEEDEDFDFGKTMREIHAELAGLNSEAVEHAKVIQKKFRELI